LFEGHPCLYCTQHAKKGRRSELENSKVTANFDGVWESRELVHGSLRFVSTAIMAEIVSVVFKAGYFTFYGVKTATDAHNISYVQAQQSDIILVRQNANFDTETII